MGHKRTTIDVWYFFVNYGQGFGSRPEDAECTEFGYYQHLVQRAAYRENCQYPLKVKKGRIRFVDLPHGWDAQANAHAEARAKVEYWARRCERCSTHKGYQSALRRAQAQLAQFTPPATTDNRKPGKR